MFRRFDRQINDFGRSAPRLVSGGIELPDVASSTRLLDLQTDAAEIVALADGDPALTWANAGAAGGSFTRGANSVEIKKQTDGDSLPYIDFGNVFQDVNWILGSNIADNLNSFTVFVVFANFSGPLITKIANDLCENPGSIGWNIYSTGLVLASTANDYVGQGTSGDITPKAVWTYEIVSTTELHIYTNGVLTDVDGATVGTGAAGGFGNSEPLRIGIDGAAGDCDPYARGKLYAVMIFAPAPNTADRTAITEWLADKYGITL